MHAFEWDEDKRLANAEKHGIDFEDAAAIFEDTTVTVEDDRFEYGEPRYVTLGLLKGVVIVVAHSERGERTRIFSARKATRNEKTNYFKQITD